VGRTHEWVPRTGLLTSAALAISERTGETRLSGSRADGRIAPEWPIDSCVEAFSEEMAMEFLANNWFYILALILFVAMHLAGFGCGHRHGTDREHSDKCTRKTDIRMRSSSP